MSADNLLLLPTVAQYLSQLPYEENDVLKNISEKNKIYHRGNISIARESVAFLTWLAKLINAKHYLEIGVFTGYSSTAMAMAMPDNAKIVCCDINVTHTNHAKMAWKEAKVEHKIQLILQPALISLQELQQQNKENYFDIALIDADKLPVFHYLEHCHKLVRKNGVIVIDNILLGGRVCDEKISTASIDEFRKFNQNIFTDQRFYVSILPVGDGMMVLIKK